MGLLTLSVMNQFMVGDELSVCSHSADTNQAVRSQKMAREVTFWIYEIEGLYYL